jgi:hypothetical protein
METTTQATTTATTPAAVAPGSEAGTEATQSDFTPAQLQKMADWAVQDGSLTRQQADAMLNADNPAANTNTAPTSNDPPAAPVELSALPPIDLNDPAMQAEHDSYMDVPRDGRPYEFDYSGAHEINSGFVNEMQGLCRDMALPGWLAKYMSKQYVKAEAAYNAGQLTRANLALQRSKAEFALRGLWKDQYAAKMQAARSVVLSLPAEKRDRVMQLLDSSGMGNDTVLLSHLATFAQHRAARKGK